MATVPMEITYNYNFPLPTLEKAWRSRELVTACVKSKNVISIVAIKFIEISKDHIPVAYECHYGCISIYHYLF